MSNKLASALFCIGIAVGTLSAPRTSRSSGGTETTTSDVNAPARAVAVSAHYDEDARASAQSATNTLPFATHH